MANHAVLSLLEIKVFHLRRVWWDNIDEGFWRKSVLNCRFSRGRLWMLISKSPISEAHVCCNKIIVLLAFRAACVLHNFILIGEDNFSSRTKWNVPTCSANLFSYYSCLRKLSKYCTKTHQSRPLTTDWQVTKNAEWSPHRMSPSSTCYYVVSSMWGPFETKCRVEL